jgi:penicillin-binding protein 1C
VAFKTGTSFGLRDAWCVGYNPEYTVGVWLGNADYGGSYALNGTREAAPLFIEIFNQLTRDHDCWYSRPEGVAERDVCVTTGLPPGPFCPHTRRDLYIPGVSEYQSCEVHRLARVRAKDGVELCRACTKEGTRYEEKVVERWPLEVAAFLRSAGRGFDLAPGHNPDCPVCPVDDTPSIKSPEDRAAYALDAGLPSDSQRIPLKASAAQDAGRLQWFIGSRLVATCLPDDTCFLEPTPGDWTVSVVDARGRSSAVDITVR